MYQPADINAIEFLKQPITEIFLLKTKDTGRKLFIHVMTVDVA